MDCKITYISAREQAAFTLVELMVAMALSLLVATAVAMLAFFSSRSFVAMADYTDMNQRSRLALDKMSKDIRQARQLTFYSTDSLTFQDVNGNSLQFTYNAPGHPGELVRVSGGQTNSYLTNCDSLTFTNYQHTVKSGTFDCYDPAYVTNTRVIQVTWICSHTILGIKATTEIVQSAQIVMRNH
jgi:prepilin-type N-terminal cleavage/methylation domain-containing protein